jgi:hypothetical protein
MINRSDPWRKVNIPSSKCQALTACKKETASLALGLWMHVDGPFDRFWTTASGDRLSLL